MAYSYYVESLWKGSFLILITVNIWCTPISITRADGQMLEYGPRIFPTGLLRNMASKSGHDSNLGQHCIKHVGVGVGLGVVFEKKACRCEVGSAQISVGCIC